MTAAALDLPLKALVREASLTAATVDSLPPPGAKEDKMDPDLDVNLLSALTDLNALSEFLVPPTRICSGAIGCDPISRESLLLQMAAPHHHLPCQMLLLPKVVDLV